MKTAMKKESKAHFPQPSSKDCWRRSGLGRDFEKINGGRCLPKHCCPGRNHGGGSANIEAAAVPQKNFLDAINKFLADTGDLTLSGDSDRYLLTSAEIHTKPPLCQRIQLAPGTRKGSGQTTPRLLKCPTRRDPTELAPTTQGYVVSNDTSK